MRAIRSTSVATRSPTGSSTGTPIKSEAKMTGAGAGWDSTGRLSTARQLLQEQRVGPLGALEARQPLELVRGVDALVGQAEAEGDGVGAERVQEERGNR